MDIITRDYAAELDNTPAALVLGIPAFTDYLLDLDLAVRHLTQCKGDLLVCKPVAFHSSTFQK